MKTLRKVKIEGFKSIERAELMLGDLNVVIGANGSGKSNLIGVSGCWSVCCHTTSRSIWPRNRIGSCITAGA